MTDKKGVTMGLMGIAAAIGLVMGAGGILLTDNARIDGRIHDYILDHPEILPEAMKRLEGRQTAQTISRVRAAVETPFAGAWAGAPRGDVTVVMFTDYSCGYCRASLPDVDRLLAEDKNVKLVWREIPILGARSEAAARVALTAAQKGNYLAVHRQLFASRDTITPPPETPEITAEIERNLALARALGITGTPSFVIGGQLLQGAIGYDKLTEAVAAARGTKA